MFEPKCLIPGKEIENVKADFRSAKRVEQYRIGQLALYMPEGLRWNYIPLSMDRGAWWAPVHGIPKSQIQLSI